MSERVGLAHALIPAAERTLIDVVVLFARRIRINLFRFFDYFKEERRGLFKGYGVRGMGYGGFGFRRWGFFGGFLFFPVPCTPPIL
jgi:hypothetical protein